MTVLITTPLAGCAFDTKSTDPLVKVGTIVSLSSSDNLYALGKFAIYVKANGIIGNSSYGTVAFTSVNVLASSVDGGAGTAYLRNGSVAFADGEFGWMYVTKTAVFQGA